ncbi:adenosylcobinamide-GDP ribazoletransferase [Butyrivibrio sp. CB08]|uniref:adenosylcobinamide-GDP ribazoletransferase n=1 Tax=Butyrivibrio sp. CB08 TaxID=2364879 RepID=UPI00131413E4|nr:adenosylcobinamide-GDP ribazoletransferase [Butyrivibrio sp. CB08]
MSIIKSIAIAFSMYSRIPMPTFQWEDREYRHAISFLPLIGAVVALIVAAAGLLEGLPVFVMTAILALIPLVITGGFHLDGFMDVMDAKSSFSDKEKSLEIMKDPHIGAFAVIGLLKLSLVWLGALYLVVHNWNAGRQDYGIYCYAAAFIAVRALCGLWSILLPKAKPDGMLARETGQADTADIMILLTQYTFAEALWAFIDVISCIGCGVALFAFSTYYWFMCKKRFGGVTGDTAGYFVVVAEVVALVVLAVVGVVVRY